MDAKEKYRPWYPELVTWMARTGLTVKEIASELGVATATLYRWRDRYPDLSAASTSAPSPSWAAISPT